MKYYKKNKRLFNCCVLLIIIYFLSTYDILTSITFRSKDYFWQVDKETFGYLDEIIRTLHNFNYLSRGIIVGVLVYLGNAYRLACENKNFDLLMLKKNNDQKQYLKRWTYSFGVVTIVMLTFSVFFSFFAKLRFLSFEILIILLINIFLYTVFINEIALFLSRKIKWLSNTRYLVETMCFSTILLEIGLDRLTISLFYNTSIVYTLVMVTVDLFIYYLLKKNDCFHKKYNCIYTTYKIK